jgi:hypothetical protein
VTEPEGWKEKFTLLLGVGLTDTGGICSPASAAKSLGGAKRPATATRMQVILEILFRFRKVGASTAVSDIRKLQQGEPVCLAHEPMSRGI